MAVGVVLEDEGCVRRSLEMEPLGLNINKTGELMVMLR